MRYGKAKFAKADRDMETLFSCFPSPSIGGDSCLHIGADMGEIFSFLKDRWEFESDGARPVGSMQVESAHSAVTASSDDIVLDDITFFYKNGRPDSVRVSSTYNYDEKGWSVAFREGAPLSNTDEFARYLGLQNIYEYEGSEEIPF